MTIIKIALLINAVAKLISALAEFITRFGFTSEVVKGWQIVCSLLVASRD